MKIIIMSAMFPPIQTGTSFYTNNLANQLHKNGHDVTVIVAKNSSDLDYLYPYKIKTIPALLLPLKNFFKHLRFCSFYIKNYSRVNKIVVENKPDVILLINHYLDIAFPAIYASRKNNIPLVINIGTQIVSGNKLKNQILRIADKVLIDNLIISSAKKIVSWDKEIERYIKSTYKENNAKKSIIIPYGVNGDITKYDKHEKNYNDVNQLVGVGAIIDTRNYVFPIRVFNELLKYYPNLIFKIIGHEYVDVPRKLVNKLGIEKNVIFTGEVSHDKVLEELSRSFLHIITSSGPYTGLGTANIEAMLSGVPVASTAPNDLFGTNALLSDMENYIYADAISIDDSVKKIRQLIDNKKTREKIGNGGREFVKKYMNWEYVAKKYEEMFQKLL